MLDPSRFDVSYRDHTAVVFEGSVKVLGRRMIVRRRGVRPGGKRERISEFTEASRRRFRERLGAVRYSHMGRCFWVTLTYHNAFPDPDSAVVDVQRFLRYFRSRFPRGSYVWRLELQKRGAPHFHLLLWFGDTWHRYRPGRGSGFDVVKLGPRICSEFWFHRQRTRLRDEWTALVARGDKYHRKYGCKVENVRRGFESVSWYLQKYVSKAEMDVRYGGRRWGFSYGIPAEPFAVVEGERVPRLVRDLRRYLAAKRRRFLSCADGLGGRVGWVRSGGCLVRGSPVRWNVGRRSLPSDSRGDPVNGWKRRRVRYEFLTEKGRRLWARSERFLAGLAVRRSGGSQRERERCFAFLFAVPVVVVRRLLASYSLAACDPGNVLEKFENVSPLWIEDNSVILSGVGASF